MSAISILNPKAEVARAAQALAVNVSAAKGIQEVLQTNLGPKGTLKMLVSGAGDIKVTKDGNVLLHEMQIQHPTASLIAKASTAQDDTTGDGTTSTVLLIGELLKQADIYIQDGLHPRLIVEGFDVAKKVAVDLLDAMKIDISAMSVKERRKILIQVSSTSLHTKLHSVMASQLTDICVDAVLSIAPDVKSQGDASTKQQVDLHMIEIQEMQHRTDMETALVQGIVLDHGGRHPDMPRRLKNVYILTCNVSLEYEKTEVNSGFFYSSAADREKLVASERQFVDDRVAKVIALKQKVCPPGSDKTFAVINQKGIDPLSLDALAKEGIIALRRAKRRNMERLVLACGGVALNSFDDEDVMDESALGFAENVYEHVLGEDKFTFVEGCRNPKSVTILLKAPTKYSLVQLKDAVRDGLRAVANAMEDGCVLPGAGAFEAALHVKLRNIYQEKSGIRKVGQSTRTSTKARLGVNAYADAMLVIPKTLSANAGFDPQESVVKLVTEVEGCGQAGQVGKAAIGIDVSSTGGGEPAVSFDAGIVDNYRVKRQMLNSATVIASNLLLVDEIMRAGMSSLKG